MKSYRNAWSAVDLQAKNEQWQLVCAKVLGLQWSHRLRAMMDIWVRTAGFPHLHKVPFDFQCASRHSHDVVR